MGTTFRRSVCLWLSDYGHDESLVRTEAERAKRFGVDAVVAAVYCFGKAWFRSHHADCSHVDALGVLCDALKGSGVEVHARFPVFIEDMLTRFYRGQHPRSACKHDGEAVIHMDDGHQFLCANASQVRRFRLEQMREMLDAYPAVDGVVLDYARWARMTCFCQTCRDEFHARTGGDLRDLHEDGRPYWLWVDWRAGVIEGFIKEARAIAMSRRKTLSATVIQEYPESRVVHGQDWKRWMDSWLLDTVTLMTFGAEVEAVRQRVTAALRLGVPPGALRVFISQDQTGTVSTEGLAAKVAAACHAGAGGVCVDRRALASDDEYAAIAVPCF